MKKTITVLSILLLLSCKRNKEKIVPIEESKLALKTEDTSALISTKLYLKNEKIALIAMKNKIPSDSVHLILNSYYIATEDDFDSELEVYENIIDSISKTLTTPKEKIASIIYDFEQVNQDSID